MFGYLFRVRGNYMTVLIEANHYDPIVHVFWPFSVWHQRFRRGPQRAKHGRNLPMMPADEDYLPLIIRTQLSGKISGLLVSEAIVDWQICRLCKPLHR